MKKLAIVFAILAMVAFSGPAMADNAACVPENLADGLYNVNCKGFATYKFVRVQYLNQYTAVRVCDKDRELEKALCLNTPILVTPVPDMN